MTPANDNAPQLADAALQRIKAYAGQPPVFDTVAEREAFFRQVYRPYGWLSDAQWRRLTETSTRRLPDGRWSPSAASERCQRCTLRHDRPIWRQAGCKRAPSAQALQAWH